MSSGSFLREMGMTTPASRSSREDDTRKRRPGTEAQFLYAMSAQQSYVQMR